MSFIERHPRALVTLLALLTFLAHARALSNGFVWDDHYLITGNEGLDLTRIIPQAFLNDFWASASQFRSEYYRPLVIVSYALERWLYGFNPAGFHLTNIVIHVMTTLLLFWFLLQFGRGQRPALAGAALFGVHPILTESVAWVAGRTDSLATMLILTCLLADQRSRKPFWALVSMLAMVLALLSKETAVTIPCLAVLAGWSRGEKIVASIADRLYMVPVLAGYFLLRFMVLGFPISSTTGTEALDPWRATLFGAHLVGLLALPTASRVDYPEGLPTQGLVVSALVGLGLSTFLALSSLRERSRTGGNALAGLTISGVLALVPSTAGTLLTGVAGDRLLYLPAVFLLPACGIAILRLSRRATLSVALAAVVTVAFASTNHRVPRWRSDIALFETALREPNPSIRARLNLAGAYEGAGRFADAFDVIQAALRRMDELAEQGTHLSYQRSLAHSLMGIGFQIFGCEDLAVEEYRRSLELDPGNPPSAGNLSGLLAATGRDEDARSVLMKAVSRRSDPQLVSRLSSFIATQEMQPVRSLASCGSALEARRRMSDIEFMNRQARVLLEKGQLHVAVALLGAALHLDPENDAARLNLARLYLAAGQHQVARVYLVELLETEVGDEAKLLLEDLEGVK